jgi:hypothetical protein
MKRALSMVLLCACVEEKPHTRPMTASASPSASMTTSASASTSPSADASDLAAMFGAQRDPITPAMRQCHVDADCTLVVVLPCGFASVAKTSAADARRAILAACPPGGEGGMGPNLPKTVCVDSRCEWVPSK